MMKYGLVKKIFFEYAQADSNPKVMLSLVET